MATEHRGWFGWGYDQPAQNMQTIKENQSIAESFCYLIWCPLKKNAHVVWSITLLVLIQFAFVFCVLPRHHTNICALAERHVKSKSGVGVGELEGGGAWHSMRVLCFFFLYDDLGPVQPRPVSIPDHLALPFLA